MIFFKCFPVFHRTNLYFTKESKCLQHLFNFRGFVFEIKKQEVPGTLKLNSVFTYGNMICRTYQPELPNIPQECKYIQCELLKPNNLTCLLATLHQCTK